MKRDWLSLPLIATMLSLLTGCGLFESEPTIYSLAGETRDVATGAHLRLWHYSESMLDLPGYWLEVVENNEPAEPNVGRSIIWFDGADLPILKYEADCYVVAVAWVNHPVRFEQKHWIAWFFFGSGVELSTGDSWYETIGQKQVCFRFQIKKPA
jgi:hypothetical protein